MQRISGKVVAGIATGAAIIAILYVIASGIFSVQAIQESFRSNIADVSSSLPGGTSKEPIAVYEHCTSTIRGDIKPRGYVETRCYEREWSIIGGAREGQNKQLASYTFALPSQLDGMTTIFTKSSVYQYGDSDFELGVYDQVGEKRYQVKLWEYPK